MQWELYHLKPTMVLPDSWHLSMTHNNWITNCWTMLCLQSSSPSRCCIWRVWSLWQVLLLWHEPNMVHVRPSFSQPGLCDVHSCSLMLVGALDELQHFIWSLEWIKWGKFKCKAPRVFMFGSTILCCIKAERVWYKSIAPYGNSEMFIIGYVFIEESLVGGSGSCFGALTSVLPTLVNQALILAYTKDCNAPGHNKLKTKSPTGPRGCLSKVQNITDLGLETSSKSDFFQLRNVYTKCSYRMKMSVKCCSMHFVENKGQHKKHNRVGTRGPT